jgi:hypothetical protein
MHSVHSGINWIARIPEHGVAFFQKTQGILGIVILCMMPEYVDLIAKKRAELRNKSAETGLAFLYLFYCVLLMKNDLPNLTFPRLLLPAFERMNLHVESEGRRKDRLILLYLSGSEET